MRRPTLALALLSALTGCAGGPLVEYRAGLTPITRPAPCEGTYALLAKNSPGVTGPIAERRVVAGQRVGFRREDDGSVTAVAPAVARPLPPGAYAWELVPGSVPPLRERLRAHARTDVKETTAAAERALLIGAVAVVVLGFSALYAYAQGQTPGGYR